MGYSSSTFGTRVIIRKTAQFLSGKFLFLLNYQKFKQVLYRHEPLFTTTSIANIISFCVSCFLSIFLSHEFFLSNLMLRNSFTSSLISHNWCHKNWWTVNVFCVIKYGFYKMLSTQCGVIATNSTIHKIYRIVENRQI